MKMLICIAFYFTMYLKNWVNQLTSHDCYSAIPNMPNLTQSVQMYPGSCSGDRDHVFREEYHLNLSSF